MKVELYPHAVVPDGREPVDLHGVRPDLVGDELAFTQERDQAGKVGRFLNSNPHRDPVPIKYRQKPVRAAPAVG